MFNPRIEVVRATDDLHREVWQFWFDEDHTKIVLDIYGKYVRPSKRHNYKVEGRNYYSRLSRRDSMKESWECPLPDNVKQEALGQLVALVKEFKVAL